MNDQLRKYKRRKQSTGQKDIRFFVEVFPLDPKASLSRALKVTPLKRGLNCNNSYWSHFTNIKEYDSAVCPRLFAAFRTISPFTGTVNSSTHIQTMCSETAPQTEGLEDTNGQLDDLNCEASTSNCEEEAALDEQPEVTTSPKKIATAISKWLLNKGIS